MENANIYVLRDMLTIKEHVYLHVQLVSITMKTYANKLLITKKIIHLVKKVKPILLQMENA